MSGVATAMIGSAVIGGVMSNNASKKAAAANQKAIDANAYQGQIATDQYEDYKTTYRPLEHSLVKDAQESDTPEAYAKAASDAQATVSEQLGMAKDRLSRTPGLDPSSPAAQAALTNLELKGAAVGASSQNQARADVKQKAYAKKLDAVGLGKGLVAGASTGMAQAGATSAAIARNQSLDAAGTAQGFGAMTAGVINGISKIDWGNKGTGIDTSNYQSRTPSFDATALPQGAITTNNLNLQPLAPNVRG